MSLPDITTREKWLIARKELLVREKALSRQRDALSADRRGLPMVEIDKDYTFEGPDGPVSLAAMFVGRSQLIIQHVMFDPAWDNPCPERFQLRLPGDAGSGPAAGRVQLPVTPGGRRAADRVDRGWGHELLPARR